ncbi:translation initiation factor IF-2-like [Serinus canaria]|uniref:translation initiation factor IF-2-like n=1 Tax=Serinus canaria TaxID=9135 RepID=UPI0021CD05C2|nr:translation initiation factor IF-2-like [Serinus canaria]
MVMKGLWEKSLHLVLIPLEIMNVGDAGAGHSSCSGRPCSRAGATLRHGSPEPSERGTAPPPAAAKRPGQATPPPAVGAASSRNPLLASRRAPRGPIAAAGQEAPVSGFSRRSRLCGRGRGAAGEGRPRARPEGLLPWATLRAMTAPDTAQAPRGAAPAPGAGPSAHIPLVAGGSKEQSRPGCAQRAAGMTRLCGAAPLRHPGMGGEPLNRWLCTEKENGIFSFHGYCILKHFCTSKLDLTVCDTNTEL